MASEKDLPDLENPTGPEDDFVFAVLAAWERLCAARDFSGAFRLSLDVGRERVHVPSCAGWETLPDDTCYATNLRIDLAV